MATQFTPEYSLPYPDGDSSVVVHTDLKNLANEVDNALRLIITEDPADPGFYLIGG